MKISDNKIALLIDAENVSEKYIRYILDELSNYGIPTYKKIYGDWSSESMKKWKNVLLTYSITPIQQYSYTSGKNSSDSALIIDAMDILYANNVQSFCIVSSDSDFTRLAARLREAGKMVIGMGEKKTPKALISACEKFIYLEVLLPKEEKVAKKFKPEIKPTELKPKSYMKDKRPKNITAISIPVIPIVEQLVIETPLIETPPIETPNIELASNEQLQTTSTEESYNHVGEKIEEIVNAIKVIINELSNDDGLASLADIGNALNRRFPEFDSRNYGFVKFSQFMSSLMPFEVIKQRPEGQPGIIHMYVKIK